MKRPHGFTLVEVLVFMALTGAIIYGLATMVTSLTSSTRQVRERIDSDQFATLLTAFLSDRANCNKNFGGRPMTAQSFTQLQDSAGHTPFKISPPTSLDGATVELAGLKFSTGGTPIGVNRRVIPLVITLKSRVNSMTHSRQINIYAEGAGSILACSANAAQALTCTQVMASSGGKSVNVYCDAVPKSRVMGCGYDDDKSTKGNSRGLYPIDPTPAHPGGGCYCNDDNDSGNIRCYANCCK